MTSSQPFSKGEGQEAKDEKILSSRRGLR